jgi:hypothetical protein
MPDLWSLIGWLGDALEELRPPTAPQTVAPTAPHEAPKTANMPADG